MSKLLIVILIILGIELAGHFLFWLFGKWNKNSGKGRISFRTIFKGLFERGFITFILLNQIPTALTLFAALKIATRIKESDEISNEYYLLGNLLSVTMAIIYSQLLFEFFN